MTRVETTLESISQELSRTRERVHVLVNSNQQLVTASEVADELRVKLADKVDTLASKIEAGILASSRAEVSLGATLSAHIEQCKTDKAELRALVSTGLNKQETMHQANTTKLDMHQARLTRLEVRFGFYAGGAVVATWLLGHGLEIIEKLFK